MRPPACGEHGRGVTLRCVLVDDDREFVEVARRLLEPDGVEVVGVATTGMDAVVQVSELQPDVVLVDVHLGEENGLEVARALLEERGSMAVILISTYAAAELRELAVNSDTAGWLQKGSLSSTAIRSVLGRRPAGTDDY